MRVTVSFRDASGAEIGRLAGDAPTGATHMQITAGGISGDMAGWALGDAGVEKVLERRESHTTGPGQGEPLFGPDSREVPADAMYLTATNYPIISKCVCGRQIIAQTRGADWEYCGA